MIICRQKGGSIISIILGFLQSSLSLTDFMSILDVKKTRLQYRRDSLASLSLNYVVLISAFHTLLTTVSLPSSRKNIINYLTRCLATISADSPIWENASVHKKCNTCSRVVLQSSRRRETRCIPKNLAPRVAKRPPCYEVR